QLLYQEGFTISGARNRLGESAIQEQENGVEVERYKAVVAEVRAGLVKVLEVLRA
ncbi:MAG TPA: MerR family transcriptional regulator, partial [Thauera sp.]|nr:MerR family transcriptional regulator [Thauera sp.]